MLRGLQTWLSPSTTTSPSPLKYIQVIFFSLVLKIERISNSWVIHYSAATCLLSLLTLVIFKLKGIGLKRRGMGFWNVSHENSQVALRSPGKERDEKSTSETDQRTDRRTDCEDDWVCVWKREVSNPTKADLWRVRQCDHLQICLKLSLSAQDHQHKQKERAIEGMQETWEKGDSKTHQEHWGGYNVGKEPARSNSPNDCHKFLIIQVDCH